MKKNIVQDVIPPKKSIRNITLGSKSRAEEEKPQIKTPPRREEKREKREELMDYEREVPLKQAPIRVEKRKESVPPPDEPKLPPTYNYEYGEPKKSSKKLLYFALVVFVLTLAFGISALFKGAKISITPKEDSQPLNATFTAKKDISDSSLGFQVVTVTKDAEKAVAATGQENVSKKAQGTIIIYNNYNTQSQKLVATTRFETPEGLIFRLVNAVTVPGQQVKDGKTVAGSVEVQVEADKAGDAYNVSFKDFTIPGFKGDPKFTKVYARSKTEMSGGFSGLQKVVSSAAVSQADKDLEAELISQLSKDIVSQIPDNFVLYSTSLTYKFDAATQTNPTGTASTTNAMLRKKGVASAVIFDKSALSRAIIAKVSPDVASDLVRVINLSLLNFTFSSTTKNTFDPTTTSSITFTLQGEADIVWNVDENKLKSDLLGLSKDSAKSVIANYGGIKEAWVETRPFWNQTIPTSPKNVTVVNTLTN